jgi:hypothetical protein
MEYAFDAFGNCAPSVVGGNYDRNERGARGLFTWLQRIYDPSDSVYRTVNVVEAVAIG